MQNASGNQPILAARGLSKTFAGRTVLRGVDLDVWPGEVHALLGQNGSGKSTLIKILSGFHEPDGGASLTVRGAPAALPLGPGDPRALGIAFVHQDLALAEPASVLENLYVGRHVTGPGWRIRWRAERRQLAVELAQFGLDVRPDTPVAELGGVDRAMLAVVRALKQVEHVEHGLLVLDEPTAYLPRDGVDRLFDAVRRLTGSGFGVLLVTHRLDEVRTIAETVTVLRDGERVVTAKTSDLTAGELVGHIIGRSLREHYRDAVDGTAAGEVVLEARRVSGRAPTYGGGADIESLDLELRAGEIVGVTGLLGMGHEAVPYLLFGAAQPDAGTVTLGGETIHCTKLSPAQAMQLGCALLPGNRLRDGSAPTATVTANVTLASLPGYFQGGVLRRRRETRAVRGFLERFDVRPCEPARIFATLSGGNQQKALLAKWFARRPTVMLLHEPTHGVDVGAKEQIFELVREAAGQGTGVLIASAEYEDLAHLCDRVLVFRYGAVVRELSGDELTHSTILEVCFGEDEQTPAVDGEPGRRSESA